MTKSETRRHEKLRPIDAINSAFFYLDEPKKRRKWTPLVTIGPKTQITKKIVEKVTSNKDYPPIPLFADNKELRNQMKIREKSPLFKIAASAISRKYYDWCMEIFDAIEQEKSKQFIGPNDFPLRIESTDEELPEEKEVV